jgi:hypothetical protein
VFTGRTAAVKSGEGLEGKYEAFAGKKAPDTENAEGRVAAQRKTVQERKLRPRDTPEWKLEGNAAAAPEAGGRAGKDHRGALRREGICQGERCEYRKGEISSEFHEGATKRRLEYQRQRREVFSSGVPNKRRAYESQQAREPRVRIGDVVNKIKPNFAVKAASGAQGTDLPDAIIQMMNAGHPDVAGKEVSGGKKNEMRAGKWIIGKCTANRVAIVLVSQDPSIVFL